MLSTIDCVPINPHRHCACTVGLRKKGMWCSNAYCLPYSYARIPHYFGRVSTMLKLFSRRSLPFRILRDDLGGVRTSPKLSPRLFTTTPRLSRFETAIFSCVDHTFRYSPTERTILSRESNSFIGPITRRSTRSAASSENPPVLKQEKHISSAINTKIHCTPLRSLAKLKPKNETYGVPLSVRRNPATHVKSPAKMPRDR